MGFFEFNGRNLKIKSPKISLTGERKNYLLLSVILLCALALRMHFFHGYGLGDDANYFSTIYHVYKTGEVPLDWSGYFYRIMFWGPVFVLFKVFGISEMAFTAPILLADLLTIIVVYFIGKTLFDFRTGLLASTLMALSPFNVAFSTAFAIDFIQTFFYSLTILFYVLAGKKNKHKIYYPLTALSILLGFYVNMKGLYILPALALFSLMKIYKKPSCWKREAILYASIAVVFLLSVTADYLISGNPLGYYASEKKISFFLPLNKRNALEYVNLMFTDKPFKAHLTGIHFWVATPLVLLSLVRRKHFSQTKILLTWFFVLFFFLNFFSPNVLGGDFSLENFTVPRIFRYLAPFFPPTTLLMSYWFWRLKEKNSKLALTALTFFLVINSYFILQVGSLAHDAQSDPRFVREYLPTLPEKKTYLDSDLKLGVERLSYHFQKNHLLVWIKRDTTLDSIGPGYVVTGGARNPFYGCMHCRFDLKGRQPPENWRLLVELNKTKTYYRSEPLRIWEVV